MEVWRFILDKLEHSTDVLLLYVLESEGSSPGRKGFKMTVATDGELAGTIGGGIMEHKIVEKAKALLVAGDKQVHIMRQYHDKQHTSNQSGMICSGSQLNAFIPISAKDKKTVESVLQGLQNLEQKTIQLSPRGIHITAEKPSALTYSAEQDWLYTETLIQQPVIHIIGGGHVGLAVSELMHFLDFYVHIYDDRPDLNTLEQNIFADKKHIVDYNSIVESMETTGGDYVLIMTVGYRTDKVVLKQLLKKDLFYLGLMGSDHKIVTLLDELKGEGFHPDEWKHVFTPVGINIFSKTPKEIAVSIAAEIIREKNKHLSTGRMKK